MDKVKMFISILVSVISAALVIEGQLMKGSGGLGLMMIGISGLLTLLYLYNKKYV